MSKNVRRTTYLQRRAGAGIGRHTTRMVRAAHKASTDPKGAIEARGLADAAQKKRSLAKKAILYNALKRRQT